MIAILIGIGATIIILFAAILVISFCEENSKHKILISSYPTISFEMFKTLYEMNPDKWFLENNKVQYCVDSVKSWGESRIENIAFETVNDQIKYKNWKEEREKQKLKKIVNERQAELLELWQKDIADYRKNSLNKLLQEIQELYEECQRKDTSPEILDCISKTTDFLKEEVNK